MNSVCLVTTAAAAAPSPTRASATGEGALISSCASQAAEQRLAYEVAAAHALRGGRVLFLSAPTSQAFSLARFAVTIERQWMALQPRRQEALSARQADTARLHHADNVTQVGCAERTASSPASARTASSEPWLQSLSSEAQLRVRQRAVLDAVRRVEVLPCTSMEDFYAVCQAYTFPTVTVEDDAPKTSAPADMPNSPSSIVCGVTGSRGSEQPRVSREQQMRGELVFPSSLSFTDSGAVTVTTAAAAAPASSLAALSAAASSPTAARTSTPHEADIVPLCIVDGFMGPTSTSALLERASGQTIPLLHYVLCLLQRRLKCAVMVVEAGGSVARSDGSGGGACWPSSSSPSESLTSLSSLSGGRPRSRSNGCGALPSPAMVLAASDLVQRLRSPHMHPSPIVPVSHAAWSLAQVPAERFSEVSGEAERQPGTKAARADGAAEHSARTWLSQAPPVSLHDVQLSVAYVEWDAVWRPLRHGDRHMEACDARNGATSRHDGLLLPFSVAWRYRVHLMKTTVGEAAGTRVGGTDNLLQNRQSRPSGPLWPPSRGSRRSSGVLTCSSGTPCNMQYIGSWMQSCQWRYL
ncbi:conserved hypothetical protein [Leishmania major strain Friedlin]|uniref:Uncharacterized protein n=1 Tax=Leishmania major TaxID=5664 RepID=Q4QBU5_LEIMA|nr:conserved hypothetical protein [Leishmania major strain Friedlin]CAG9573918.1 hypothetical_protein_-_conserved [Leishmania major strain Friedlin]CAJ04138.1 conserved hypothetical protein [Leishmania major strain Friedlin]|eukprot:XP_001683203.1 conserved hypothetical protein [Leishmania major strain Friedlin]